MFCALLVVGNRMLWFVLNIGWSSSIGPSFALVVGRLRIVVLGLSLA